MKKLSYLLVLLVAFMIIPFGVFAEENTEEVKDEAPTEEVSKEVPIYFFMGDGCSYCASAKDWFAEIEEEHGDKFEVVPYETWYNQENAELMQKVAEARNETADGVPYIIIGEKSWAGFAEDYIPEILSQINEVYEQEVSERYDIMQLVETGSTNKKEKSTSEDILSLIIILVVVGGIGFAIYKTRKSVN